MILYRLTFDSKNLVFPPTIPGQPVYRTTLLTNTGDTPIFYDIAQDPTEYVEKIVSHAIT